jgi:hypothetical protein
LQTTNQLAEAEPLMRRGLKILIAFTKHDYQHPKLRAGMNNYIKFLQTQGLSEAAIQARIASLHPQG